MNKSEAYSGVVSRLRDIFLERGFEPSKNKISAFVKKTDYGYQRFFIEILDYNPKQKIEFGSCIKHDKIETIIELIDQKFNLRGFSKVRDTTAWGYPYSLGSSVNKCFVTKEEDFERCIEFINKHLDKYISPFYESFCDIRNIDKEINGIDFWKTDWQMPYGLAGLFPFKRTIIAHLCANPRIDDIKAYHMKTWNTLPDCEQLLLAYDYLFEYLKGFEPLDISNHE